MNVQPNKGPTVNASIQCTAANPTGRGYCGTLLLKNGQCPRCGAMQTRGRRGNLMETRGPRRSLAGNQCDTPGCGTLLLADGSCPRCQPVAERSPSERRKFAVEMRDHQLAEQLEAEDEIAADEAAYAGAAGDDDDDDDQREPVRPPPGTIRRQPTIAERDAAINAEVERRVAAELARRAPPPAPASTEQPAKPGAVAPGKPPTDE